MYPAMRAAVLDTQLVRPDMDLDAGDRLTTDGAASFASASSQSLSVASNSGLQTGNVDFWASVWFKTSTGSGNHGLLCKSVFAASAGDFYLYKTNTTAFVGFGINSASGNQQLNSPVGSLADGAWHLAICYQDVANNRIGLSIDGGAFATATRTLTTTTNTQPLTIGAFSDPTGYWNGQIDSVIFGKSPPGGIAALATTIRDALYNGGSGLPAKALSSAQRTDWGVVSGWDFDGPSGNLVKDYIGSNTLTNNNTVTYAAGKVVSSILTDADAVASWFDPYGATTWSQSTVGSRPLWKAAILDSRYAVVRGNGSTQYLSGGTNALDLARATAGLTMLVVVKYGNVAGNEAAAAWSIGGATSARAAFGAGTFAVTGGLNAGGRTADGGSFEQAEQNAEKSTAFVLQAGLLDYAGGPIRLRVNGVSYGSGSFASPAITPNTASQAATLFCNTAVANFLQGDIARLLVWRRLLRPDQIRAWERHLGRRYNIAVAG